MKRVGILGGTFNPPHIGHLIIANEVKYALHLDEVRLMPTAAPPHKEERGDATASQRLRMVELAVQGVDGLSAFPFEVDRGGVSYTYETMKALRLSEPNTHFHFIIGGDMIDYLPKWHRIDKLLEMMTFVGVARPGAKNDSPYEVEMIRIPEIDLSSTFIRKRIAENGPVTFLIPPEVETFIRKEKLYGC